MADRLKHRWSVLHNYLAGITAPAWWRLLRDNNFAIDPVYWHRASFITVTSLMNSWFKRQEDARFGQLVERTAIQQPPLFILGHWRSGTTHLHYLLAQDTEQFGFANTYQVVNPDTFLVTEEKNKRRFARLVPSKRPMDNMALGFDTPQEDEFAPCLTSLLSPYLGISFPRREQHYVRYLSFDTVPEAEIAAWTQSFVRFLKKLTFKSQRTLLLKSPTHTARIGILLKLFPHARFVHVHRHPYRVFQSTRHYFDTAMWYTYLQQPDLARIDEGIFDRYTLLHDAFFRDRALVAPGQFYELSFEDLERDPMRQLAAIYEHFNLPEFSGARPKFEAYLQSLTGYQKNEFADLPPALRQQVAKRWQRSFEEWKYSE